MSERSLKVKALRCIACVKEGVEQPHLTEEHHLNEGGHAGQRRRGDRFSIPLDSWHHRGVPVRGMNSGQMAYIYGPSLALQPRLFRETYGNDDSLLDETNRQLEKL